MRGYIGYLSAEMDLNSHDRRITTAICRWMDGSYGEGEQGIISRNDALFSLYEMLAKLGKYCRNKREDSTVFKSVRALLLLK